MWAWVQVLAQELFLAQCICQLGFANYISSFIYWFKLLSCCFFNNSISEIQPIFSFLFPSFIFFFYYYFFLPSFPISLKWASFLSQRTTNTTTFFFFFFLLFALLFITFMVTSCKKISSWIKRLFNSSLLVIPQKIDVGFWWNCQKFTPENSAPNDGCLKMIGQVCNRYHSINALL